MKRNVPGCVTFKIGKRRVVKGTVKELLVNGYLEPYIPHNMIKFPENTETKIDLEKSKKLNGVWSNSALGTNRTRTFIFKLHSNTAGFNVTFLVNRTKRTKHHYIYSLNALQ
jgi:hypothetical protein